MTTSVNQKRYTIEDMRRIAEERKGKCVSDKYTNPRTPLLWECEKGHRWFSSPSNMLYAKAWCPYCAKCKKSTIENMQKIAMDRGGKCISEKYINAKTPLIWECKEKHRWKAAPADIINGGTWCPKCAFERSGERQRYHEDYIKFVVTEKGGEWVFGIYRNSLSKIKIKCQNGHVWETTIGSILAKHWCPECAGHTHYSIEQMRDFAKEKGGKCLSDEFINSQTPLLWECEKRHQWRAISNNIINQGTWCPKCAGKARHTIEEMQEIAQERGGKCVSEIYNNMRTHLLWECKKGHRWESTASDIIFEGVWCQKCANKIPFTIGMMREAAQKRGGKCLSEIYVNMHTALLWECENGHRWEAEPVNITHHNCWCPKCAHSLPITIAEMKELALSRGGICLSDECNNNRNKLKWECVKKHTWEASPNVVKNGHWCPKCAQEDAGERYRFSAEQVRTSIEERGGKWISGQYLNTNSKLQVKCNDGHIWNATLGNIRSGHWCPECAKINRKLKSEINQDKKHVTEN
jgi:hypothetical protein